MFGHACYIGLHYHMSQTHHTQQETHNYLVFHSVLQGAITSRVLQCMVYIVSLRLVYRLNSQLERSRNEQKHASILIQDKYTPTPPLSPSVTCSLSVSLTLYTSQTTDQFLHCCFRYVRNLFIFRNFGLFCEIVVRYNSIIWFVERYWFLFFSYFH